MAQVGIVMGSDSDMPVMSKAADMLEKFGIDRKDSYAFGDSDNDVEMLRAVGTGVVMGKHSKAAGEAATMFTGTVKEEGITTGLERLGLI